MQYEILFAGAALAVFIFILYVLVFLSGNYKSFTSEEIVEEESQKSEKKLEIPSKIPQKTNALKSSKPLSKYNTKAGSSWSFAHLWLTKTFRSSRSHVLDFDFSPNGKYLVATFSDRTILIWTLHGSFAKLETVHNYPCNTIDDTLLRLVFSPDSKAVVGIADWERDVQVYRLTKRDTGAISVSRSEATFPGQGFSTHVISLYVAPSGAYIAVCQANLAKVVLYDLHGNIIQTFESKMGTIYSMSHSRCGTFLCVTGFMGDAKVLEVETKGGTTKMSRAFDLSGHNTSVLAAAFDTDNKKMLSWSRANTLKLWNIDVPYKQGADPKILKNFTGLPFHLIPTSGNLDYKPFLEFSHQTAVVAYGKELRIISLIDGSSLHEFDDFPSPLTQLRVDVNQDYILFSVEKSVCIVRNVAALKTQLECLNDELVKAKSGSAIHERMMIRKDLFEKELSRFE